MKKIATITLMFILLLSCSKDDSDSSSNNLTSKEKALIGKWYNDTFDSTFGSLDMSCATCYWEFLPTKSEDGVFLGIISNELVASPTIFWGTGADGQIYVMVDALLTVKSISNSQLILTGGGSSFTFHK